MYDEGAKDALDRLHSRVSPEVVETVAQEMVRLGPEALRLLLTFPEPLVFQASRHWIVSIALRMKRDEAVPVLIAGVGDEVIWRKRRAEWAEALGMIGPSAKEAIPVLVKALGHCRHYSEFDPDFLFIPAPPLTLWPRSFVLLILFELNSSLVILIEFLILLFR